MSEPCHGQIATGGFWYDSHTCIHKLDLMKEVEHTMSLPTDDKDRKALPIWDGVIMYFPLALAAVAEVSQVGNSQHNPGQKLHWAKGKSMDQMNTAFRHMMDYGMGTVKDTDGTLHLAKAAWRLLARLQLDLEKDQVTT